MLVIGYWVLVIEIFCSAPGPLRPGSTGGTAGSAEAQETIRIVYHSAR